MTLNLYSVVPFLSSLLAFSLGLFTYTRNRSSRIHQRFFWLCMAIFLWPLSLSIFLNLSDPRTIIFWTKLGHSTCTIAPAVFFDLVITLVGKEHLRWVSRLYYALACVIVLACWVTDWYFPGGVTWYAWGPYPVSGPLVAVDALIATGVALVCYGFLFQACHAGKHTLCATEVNKLRYMTAALVIFSLALVDYLPKYGVPVLPLGSVFIAAFAVLVAYAILRHHLLDITVAIRRTVVYSVLVALITAVYFSFVLATEKLLQGVIGYRSLIGSVVAGFVIALGFNPLKELIQHFIDRLFFKGSQATLAAENERLRQELVRSERLKAVATLAAGMAHEIKNPLSSIKTFAEYLPEKYDDAVFREKFARIMGQEVGKINDLVQRLLEFAKPHPPQKQPARLSNLIEETVEFLNGTLLGKQIEVIRAYSAQDEALVDSAQMKQVFLNVLLNSIEAIRPPGHIAISTAPRDGHLEVLIEDSGPGIPQKDLPHVFDPFYTTKPSGTGLGLSVVHSIVREHGGRIAIHSGPGRGTTLRISFPTEDRSQKTDARSQI